MDNAKLAPLEHYDLRSTVPQGWILQGLTRPKSDGVNVFREPENTQSRIAFSTQEAKFVQLRYQLYSPQTDVTGSVQLDGKTIGEKTFPKGKFVNNHEVGGFVAVGDHTVTLTYLCGGKPCTTPVSQYWTQVTLVRPSPASGSEDIGPGVVRWSLNAPNSPLKISGVSQPLFDGGSYYQNVQQSSFQLSWPSGVRPLNISFQLYAAQPFRITTRLDGQIASVKWGSAKSSVNSYISMIPFPTARSITVQVECLKTGKGCATLYFPRVSVMPLIYTPGTFGWIIIFSAFLFMLLALWILLGFAGLKRAVVD